MTPPESLNEHVKDSLFEESFDSLASHIDRKQALADTTRYSILYRVYELGQIQHSELVEEATSVDEDDLQSHLNTLVDVNLLARVPSPEENTGSDTVYRITTLGKQEVQADIDNIHPETRSDTNQSD